MTREEVIAEIVDIEETKYYTRKTIKESALDELEEAADEEGCEWGEQTPNIINLYRRLQPDYCSEEFANALYEEVINLYMHMLENTDIVEYPEEVYEQKVPARKVREWDY